MKLTIQTFIAAIGLTVLASIPGHAQILYNSVTDFSGTQGYDDWYYEGVNFNGYGTLATTSVFGTFDLANQEWDVSVPYGAGPGNGTVRLDATSQDYTAGNAIDSLRVWKADQNYSSVSFSSLFSNTTAATFNVILTLANGSESLVGQDNVFSSGSGTLNSTAPIAMNAGDSLYFELNQTGSSGDATNIYQDWNITVSATPVATPEPSTYAMLALGFGVLGLIVVRRRTAALV